MVKLTCMVDLHTHSTESDGTLTPEQLVEHATNEGVTALALTDHDTCAGIAAATGAGDELGVQVIPGIEIEVDYSPGTFHLLGLGIYRWRNVLEPALKELAEHRVARNLLMVQKIQDAGIPADYKAIMDIAGGSIVGRPHFAQFLMRQGVVNSVQEAFNRYLAEGKPFYAARERLSLARSVRLIHEAGGKAVIAHPNSLHLSATKLQEKLVEWKETGVDGVEAFHSNATYSECKRYEAMANELNLLITAGSDFHGPHRIDRRLGRTVDNKKIDDAYAAPFLAGA